MIKHILITGVSGFVGAALAQTLIEENVQLTCLTRVPLKMDGVNFVAIEDINSSVICATLLQGIDTVIHCAARAHVMKELSPDPLAEYRRVNVDATMQLARAAADAGVKRFIFLSSVKVNGEATLPGKPWSEENIPHPHDAYGISKWEAEQGLQELAATSSLEIVIIRLPLVYGAGVKANFLSMLTKVQRGLPLPLAAVRNKRSFVYLGNLISLIVRCIDHPNAANQVFFVSDDADLSTSELLRHCARAFGKKSRLFSVPVRGLRLGAALMGKRAVSQRLLGSLQVDINKAKTLLDWAPPYSVDEGLKLTVQALLQEQK